MTRKEELKNIFKNADDNVKQIIEQLIEEAVYQEEELRKLHDILDKTGFVRVHPDHPNIQKFMPAAKAYKELNQTYNNTIKTLHMIYSRNETEPDDDAFSEFMNKYKKGKDNDAD